MPASAVATGVGIALTPEMYPFVSDPAVTGIDFLELDPDTFTTNDVVIENLKALRERFPMTLHSTRLSMCGDNELDERSLQRTRRLADLVDCQLYSDHLALTWVSDINLDLYLPPLFTAESIDYLIRRADAVRSYVECEIALENVGMIIPQPNVDYDEVTFIEKALGAADLSFQLNLDSVAISATTLGLDSIGYLARFPFDRVSLVTVVPETSMNPVLRKRYGSGINDLMNAMLAFVMTECSPPRIMIQGRRGDQPVEFLAYLSEARKIFLDSGFES